MESELHLLSIMKPGSLNGFWKMVWR